MAKRDLTVVVKPADLVALLERYVAEQPDEVYGSYRSDQVDDFLAWLKRPLNS